MEPMLKTETENQNKKWYMRGLRDGIPIGLGYFAVGFTLGIAAREAGITAFQMGLMSLLMHASAGQFAAITIIAGNSGFVAMVLTQLVINIRYLLMSCALSQKISPDTSMAKRPLLSYFVTDEIFGIAVSVKGTLNPFYNYGAATVASPGWALGTVLGVLVGNILPLSMVSALSVALYGMFLAVVIPAAKENRAVSMVVLASMAFPAIITATSTPISGIVAFITAIVVSWIDGNLFKVAVASCIAVYVTELIVL